MKISINEQRELDILIKELRIKTDLLEENVYMFSPDTRDFLRLLSRIILILEHKLN